MNAKCCERLRFWLSLSHYSINRPEGLRKITNNLHYDSRPTGLSQRNFRISSISVQEEKLWRLYPVHGRCASTKLHGAQLEKSSVKNTELIKSIRKRHASILVLKNISVRNNKTQRVQFTEVRNKNLNIILLDIVASYPENVKVTTKLSSNILTTPPNKPVNKLGSQFVTQISEQDQTALVTQA